MACRSYQHLDLPDDSAYNTSHVACVRFSASSPFVRRQAELEGILFLYGLDTTNTFLAMSYATCAYTSVFPAVSDSSADFPNICPAATDFCTSGDSYGGWQAHSQKHGSRASTPLPNEFLVPYVMNINVAVWAGSQLYQGHL